MHNNEIVIVGRAGIAKLLNLALDDGDDDASNGTPAQGPVRISKPSDSAGVVAVDPNGGGSPIVPARVPEPDQPLEPDRPEHRLDPVATRNRPAESAGSDEAADVSMNGEINIYLGKNAITGVSMSWNPSATVPSRLTNQHLLVVGESGSGKSETTKAIIWELNRRNVPSIVFDFQGEYASGDFFDAVKPQVFNSMQGLPVNPLELPIDPLTGRKKAPIEMVFRLRTPSTRYSEAQARSNWVCFERPSRSVTFNRASTGGTRQPGIGRPPRLKCWPLFWSDGLKIAVRRCAIYSCACSHFSKAGFFGRGSRASALTTGSAGRPCS